MHYTRSFNRDLVFIPGLNYTWYFFCSSVYFTKLSPSLSRLDFCRPRPPQSLHLCHNVHTVYCSPTQLWFWTESLPLFLLEVSYRWSAGWTSNWANELLAATAVNQETWGRAARGHQKYFLSNIWTVGAVWFGSRPTSSPNLHRAGTVPLITSQTTMKMLLKLLL